MSHTMPLNAPHAVQRLYQKRKAQSTKEFKARGSGVDRCLECQIDKAHCICQWRRQSLSDCGFLLLMYDSEVLKPSNTGRLIADVIPNTFAFLWQRTEIDAELKVILSDNNWQPIVVFPKEYSEPERVIEDLNDDSLSLLHSNSKAKPLFILLDGTWREAKKMFRKSPYLQGLPVLSINEDNPEKLYHIRKSINEHQLATAEVAAKVLALADDKQSARHLAHWFDVFSYQYQLGVKQTNKGDASALENYQTFLKQSHIL